MVCTEVPQITIVSEYQYISIFMTILLNLIDSQLVRKVCFSIFEINNGK